MTTWLRLIAVAMELPPVLDAQLRRDQGISHFAYYVMAILSEAPDRTMQMNELASRTNGSLSRLSHVISKVEKLGWVQRQISPHDARATLATLTESGWEKVVASAPGHVESVRVAVFDNIAPEDVATLGRILEPIKRALDDQSSEN